MWTWSSPPPAQKERGGGTEVELKTYDGQPDGTYRTSGTYPPALLFRGRRLYVRDGDRAVRRIGPAERPLALLASMPKGLA